MNSPANAIPESRVRSQVVAESSVSPFQRFYWTVRREFWENRYLYIAPMVAAGVGVIGFVVGATRIRSLNVGAHQLGVDADQSRYIVQQPYDLVAGLLMGVTMIVAAFYCLDALHGERRDRSILFWKSLPVSDVTTVLAKASIPLLFLPIIEWLATLAAHTLMLMLSSIVLAGTGVSAWQHLAFVRMSVLLLYHLFTAHSLWWAPFFAWFLMVSAWARRLPILWAVLPVAVMVVVEQIAFGSSHFLGMLINRFGGESYSVTLPTPHAMPMHPMAHMTPGHFLLNPQLWMGFAVAAVFLAVAVRLRRYRGPI